ncbi:bifunctional diaminohydroxyphosphoribosylaminopyrimidine deaminase/5-amino-6-(5-phosphoribosylamino)uracil reductase RibD [Rapidithrix thailandica]|uniref:Riboflavin biosynthesis protein RibD n=1 Tax=Rapidithrix thailandica TaxID=413964 RepID=A0AAW9SGC5_9BACT
MEYEEIFMQRALELARYGRGKVSPNPMVGCVIVYEGQIIGEGYHKKYGEAHAEVNAVRSVREPEKLKESTLYVTLEPCSHFGKTPPCADLIIQHKIPKVVVATTDPNPQVAGRGLKKLTEAGVEVYTGVHEKEAQELNKRFFTQILQKRPYIILKWAETADGFIARDNYDSKWISDWYSRKLVHRWRSEEDAILVGGNTAKYDDPKLNVRSWTGRNPIRIVIDRTLQLNKELHLFDGSQLTLCFNEQKTEKQDQLEYIQLADCHDPRQLIQGLRDYPIQSLIVEGGSAVLHSFLQAGLWDELRVFKSKTTFGSGIPAPHPMGCLVQQEQLLNDHLYIYRKDT